MKEFERLFDTKEASRNPAKMICESHPIGRRKGNVLPVKNNVPATDPNTIQSNTVQTDVRLLIEEKTWALSLLVTISLIPELLFNVTLRSRSCLT